MKTLVSLALAPILLVAACGAAPKTQLSPAEAAGTETATLAGGCFWCVEAAFDDVPGVVEAVSGYTGGPERSPSYEQVAAGRTGHVEAVRVRFEPERISYREILDIFWRNIDPTDDGGQFADRGSQYRPAIFVHDASQRAVAQASLRELERSGPFDEPIVVPIREARAFWVAEAYHQDHHRTNASHYKRYYEGSGRGPFVRRTWADQPLPKRELLSRSSFARPSDSELRQRLTPMQYEVTQHDGTEPPFRNAYWNETRAGLYVDVISGEPLFSSTDKFKSGTGWPSFTRPISRSAIREKVDRSLGVTRTEVRSAIADSHLGHVFADGPEPTGLRYCINSAALRFVPEEKLAEEGLGVYRTLFDEGS